MMTYWGQQAITGLSAMTTMHAEWLKRHTKLVKHSTEFLKISYTILQAQTITLEFADKEEETITPACHSFALKG